MTYLLIFIALFALSIANAIVPLPGSSVITPLLTLFISPKDAIAFATIYFMISSILLVYAYRKYLRPEYIKGLLPSSIIGALIGALFYLLINEQLALAIVAVFVAYFTFQRVQHARGVKAKKSKLPKPIVGAVSGLFQGSGFAGGDIRNGYLYGQGLSAQDVRATTAIIGAANFGVATLVRGIGGQLNYDLLWLFIFLTPMLIAATYFGRYLTLRLSEQTQNIVIVFVMVVSLAIVIGKLIESLQ